MAKSRHLTEQELRTVSEGLQKGASKVEQADAALILAKVGFQKKTEAKRKPGPKRKQSTNTTEKELGTRIAWIRLVLGKRAKNLTHEQVLFEVLKIIDAYYEWCEDGLFFSHSEKSFLVNYRHEDVRRSAVSEICEYFDERCGGLGSLSKEQPSDFQLHDWLITLAAETRQAAIAKPAPPNPWEDLVHYTTRRSEVTAMKGTPDNSAKETSLSGESEIFDLLKLRMKLDIPGPSLKELDAEIESLRCGLPEQHQRKSIELVTLENERWQKELYPITRRNEILRAAIAMLLRIRYVVDRCRYVSLTQDLRTFFEFVQSVSAGALPGELPPALCGLNTIAIEAVERQLVPKEARTGAQNQSKKLEMLMAT